MKHLIHFTLLLTAWVSVIAENQPYLNLTPTRKSITISNSALNTIGKWMDTRGVEFQQADPIQQPSLINFQGNNVVGFLPKSYLSNKYVDWILEWMPLISTKLIFPKVTLRYFQNNYFTIWHCRIYIYLLIFWLRVQCLTRHCESQFLNSSLIDFSWVHSPIPTIECTLRRCYQFSLALVSTQLRRSPVSNHKNKINYS